MSRLHVVPPTQKSRRCLHARTRPMSIYPPTAGDRRGARQIGRAHSPVWRSGCSRNKDTIAAEHEHESIPLTHARRRCLYDHLQDLLQRTGADAVPLDDKAVER